MLRNPQVAKENYTQDEACRFRPNFLIHDVFQASLDLDHSEGGAFTPNDPYTALLIRES